MWVNCTLGLSNQAVIERWPIYVGRVSLYTIDPLGLGNQAVMRG